MRGISLFARYQPVGLELGLPLTSVAAQYLRLLAVTVTVTGCAKHGNEERQGRCYTPPDMRRTTGEAGAGNRCWVTSESELISRCQ